MEHFGLDPSNTSLLRLQQNHVFKYVWEERHTFHFPNGECTITLEYVAYQLSLPIDGKAITGDTSMDWGDLCLQLLGVAPTDKQINGQRVQHTWMESIYQQLPEDADDEVVKQLA
ncbi:hypothetical protein Lal_00031843 [Lupinus albus]|nr:hypothetical protein Lal_00031843 [Lupinus albus]